MKESNSLSPSRCGPACLYRRSGLLSTVLFDRSGDRYIVSRAARNEAIDSVLWFRRQALDWYCLAEDAILPSRVHSDALQHFALNPAEGCIDEADLPIIAASG